MASDQQLALTRSQRMPAPSSHISKAARQVVPAFLQKLYEMVNDPNNAELIRWSETGDSFFVLDHERFAHEVLGRWFKHRNFSSFVRQLNMYGFHKIPHLQQGVLKSDTDTEFWNFAHANFHRNQPDMLCLIQRKKQAAQQGDEASIDIREGSAGVGLIAGGPNTGAGGTNVAGGTASLSNGQVLDVQSIVSGINAIKRHQTTISAELNELKRSNQLLWQDALAARGKHQKQQDTINRIVKFLAGVFGNHPAASGAGGVSVSGSPVSSGGVAQDATDGGPRRRMRLMIEDAKRDGPAKSMIEELSELPMELDTSTQYDYPTIETPISIASPSPSVDGSSYYNLEAKSETPASAPTEQIDTPKQPQAQTQQATEISRAVTPSRSPTMLDFDSRVSGMLSQLSQPQIQQLLATLAAQTITDPSLLQTASNAGTIQPDATSTLTQYQAPNFDFTQANPGIAYNNQIQMVSPEGLISFDHYNPQLPVDTSQAIVPSESEEHARQLEKQWTAAEDIDNDVNAINTSINSLIQTFGLDPSLFEGMDQHHDDSTGAAGGMTGLSNGLGNPIAAQASTPAPGPEFDFDTFDTFFNNLSAGSGAPGTSLGLDVSHLGGNGAGVMDYTDLGGAGTKDSAFLGGDRTPTASSDMTASPVQPLRQVSPEIHKTDDKMTTDDDSNTGLGVGAAGGGNAAPTAGVGIAASTGKGRKRKSEVIMDFDASAGSTETATKSGPGTKSKRRKDK